MSESQPPLIPPQRDVSAAPPHSIAMRGLMTGPELERPRATFTPPSLERLLPVVLQNWKFILTCTLLGLVAAIGALPLMETRYLITAKILVQMGREMTAPPTALAKDTVPQIITSMRPEVLGSEIEIMKSPALTKDVVEALGTDFFLAEPPAVTLWQQAKRLAHHTIRFARDTVSQGLIMLGVRRPVGPVERVALGLQTALSVDDVRKSDIISVSLQMSSPDAGVAVLQKYLELFQEKHIAAHRSPRNREFFEAAVARTRQQLQETQARLARFKDERKVWSITEQSNLLLKTQNDLADAHARTLRETAELETRSTELRRQEALLPEDLKLSRIVSHDPVNDEMRKQRAQVEAQMAQTAVLFGDLSPQMMQLRRQLNAVKAGIAERTSSRGDQEITGVNQQLNDVRKEIGTTGTQLSGLQARATVEQQNLDDIEKQIQRLSSTETALYDMQREVGRLEREYQLYTARLEDSRISEAMDLAEISNVRVISPPTAGSIPVYPPLLFVIGGGVAIGLVGSLGLVFFRDAMRPVVRTRRDIEQLLGVPVLTSVSYYPGLR